MHRSIVYYTTTDVWAKHPSPKNGMCCMCPHSIEVGCRSSFNAVKDDYDARTPFLTIHRNQPVKSWSRDYMITALLIR
jgi:hypothetical protein